jgi:hypothetical protein
MICRFSNHCCRLFVVINEQFELMKECVGHWGRSIVETSLMTKNEIYSRERWHSSREMVYSWVLNLKDAMNLEDSHQLMNRNQVNFAKSSERDWSTEKVVGSSTAKVWWSTLHLHPKLARFAIACSASLMSERRTRRRNCFNGEIEPRASETFPWVNSCWIILHWGHVELRFSVSFCVFGSEVWDISFEIRTGVNTETSWGLPRLDSIRERQQNEGSLVVTFAGHR